MALVMIGSRFGMFVVETIARARRAHFVQGKSIKLICRELRVSRKVVRKVLRSEATEFRYEREAQPLPRIGPWRDEQDRLLASNEAKPRCERLTLIRVFETLGSLHGLLRIARLVVHPVSSCDFLRRRALRQGQVCFGVR